MLLLHGFGASSSHWRRNAIFFSTSGYRVYALDLLGFGKSDQPSVNSSLKGLDNELWGKQICSFLREIVQTDLTGRAVLIGNSLGGLAALTATARNVNAVAALVTAPLPDPALMRGPIRLRNRFFSYLKEKLVRIFFSLLPLEIILPLITRSFLIRQALQAAYFCNVESDKDLLRIVTKPAMRSSAAGSLRAMCIGMSLRLNASTAPELIGVLDDQIKKVPFLMIWGRNDRFVPFDIGRQIKTKHPWINFLVMDSSGHCPHDETSDSFNHVVFNWLSLSLEKQEQDL